MTAADALMRTLDSTETEALGPMPDSEEVSPTTDRVSRSGEFTAEEHHPGTLAQEAPYPSAEDPFPPPRSLTEED